jgi:putative phosphoribosyl transferase
MIFRDRRDAGRRLAERLGFLQGQDAVVLGLPRGGVPVAAEVARALDLPLDVIVVRKLGVPFQPELAMGAVGEGGVVVTNDEVLRQTRTGQRELALVEAHERQEVERRAQLFRAGRAAIPVAGRVAVLVDDGIATGSTARAACQVARALGASRVLLAVPVAPADSLRLLAESADDVICLETPEVFFAVGEWYADFAQTSDDEVIRLLVQASQDRASRPVHSSQPEVVDVSGHDQEVEVDVGPVRLAGHLAVPHGATGVVLFVHGSGSSRHSPRNRAVAAELGRAGLGTLLFDLLTQQEQLDRSNVFDIELLAGRLTAVTSWLRTQPACSGLRIGYFGASTGAAAALWAAAEPGAPVAAVVSRGGRPDLARTRLHAVTAPTLLLVGGRDNVVLGLNREAQALLRCETALAVIPGATHLFEEPGALQRVSELAKDWFVTHLVRQVVSPES